MARKTNCTKNGVAYYRLTATVGHKPDGKPKRKEFYGKSKKEAESKRDEYLEGIRKGLDAGYEKIEFRSLFTEWLNEVHKPTIKQSTYNRYESLYRIWITPAHYFLKPVIQIKSIDIQKHINTIPSPDTAMRVYNLQATFFKYCIKERLIIYNPLDNVNLPKIEEKTDKKNLNNDDVDKLLRAFKTDSSLLVFVFDMITGLRVGELCALTVNDIDLDSLMINVDSSLNRVSFLEDDGKKRTRTVIGPPKTKASTRKVPIAKELVRPLKEHIRNEKAKHLRLGVRYTKDSPFFSSQVCTSLRADHLNTRWKKIQNSIGIDQTISFHKLRHTFATLCAKRGVQITAARDLLGHDTIETTAKIYTHVDKEMREEAIDLVGSII